VGMVRHFAYPLEWTVTEATADAYLSGSRNVARNRNDSSRPVNAYGRHPGLEVYRLTFSDSHLLIAVNEAAVERTARFWLTGDSGSRENLYEITFPPGVTRMLLVDHEGTILDLSHDLEIREVER